MTMEFEPESHYWLPLKDVALRRLAVLLCGHPVRYMLAATVRKDSKEKQETAMDEMLKGIVAEISLPKSTEKELVSIMKPVFKEIIKWLNFHDDFLEPEELESNVDTKVDRLENLEHICWTRLGTISYLETARSLIRVESLDVDHRYMLACLYCLEDDILNLYKKVSIRIKKRFYNNGSPLGTEQPEIAVFWTYLQEGGINDLYRFLMQTGTRYSSSFQYAFETSAQDGFKSAADFFFRKLTLREREVSLVRTAKAVAKKCASPVTLGDVLCYLLSLMRAEQRQEVLESRPCETLRSFLDWPRQDAFLNVAKLVLPHLSEHKCRRLLFILARNVTSGYNFSKLFRYLFVNSPRNFKNYTRNRYTHFLQEFFRIGDVDTIKFIFSNLDATKTVELAFSNLGLFSCYDLVKEGRWDMLDLFIRESRLSKEDRGRFVISFVSHFKSLLEEEKRLCFIKFMSEMDGGTSNQDLSKCDPVNQTDDLQPTGQPDEEIIERPAKKKKKA